MSTNKVFWISYPFPPAVSAGVFRSVRFIKYLPEFGWQPTVFTVEPDELMPTDPSLMDLLPKELEVHSRKMWRPDQWLSRKPKSSPTNVTSPKTTSKQNVAKNETAQKPGRLKTAYRNLKDRILATPDQKIWWSRPAYYDAVRLLKNSNMQAIFSTAPPHSSHLLGVWLKRKTGLPLILDFRDPWSRSPWSKNHTPYIERVNQKMERRCVQAANAIILNTENAKDEFVRFYGSEHEHKFHTIYNGFDPDLLESMDKIDSPDRLEDRPLKVCHVGTIYGRREIRPLLQAISEFNQTNQRKIRFEQIGHLRVDYDVNQVLSELGLEDAVSFTPQIPHSEALKKMGSADALLLLQPDGDLQVPGKLFEMILFKKPIITLTGQGATRDVADKFNLGPIAEASNVQDMVCAFQMLTSAGNSDESSWDTVLDAFNGRNQTKYLAEIFDSVLKTA